MCYKGGMRDVFDRSDVVVGEVEVRPDERRRWDALMAEHHLGFRQFAGRRARPPPPASGAGTAAKRSRQTA